MRTKSKTGFIHSVIHASGRANQGPWRDCRKAGSGIQFVSRHRGLFEWTRLFGVPRVNSHLARRGARGLISSASFRKMAISMVFLAALGIGLATVPSAHAAGYATTLLYSFASSGGDGTNPAGGALIMDVNGNLYGTTPGGGAYGFGTVFELVNSSGTYSEKVLYSFTNGADGGFPSGGVLIDASGNLYGTTARGGASGLGTVFELLNSSGTYSETVLHSFTGSPDGQIPNGGLVRDTAGNLYGVTYNNSLGAFDNGAVFELVNSSGTYSEKVLYTFTGQGSAGPRGPLIIDASGNLFGNAVCSVQFCTDNGVVFELVNSSGTYSQKVLYRFTGPDGSGPIGSLIMDASGNLFGATSSGGSNNGGTVFELVSSLGTYSETVLYSFLATATDGASPNGSLIRDASGNFYGTTQSGGTGGTGTVFELVNSSGAYTEKVLHSFLDSCVTDGENPQSGLVMDASRNVFGTTSSGGSTGFYGTVFELVPFTGQAATTTTALTSSLNPATAGDPVTLMAAVTPNSNSRFILSGTVTISNGSIVLSTGPLTCFGGSGTQPTTQLMVEDADVLGIGANALTAQFTPDTPAFARSSDTLNQMVNEPGVVLTKGNNTLTGNQTVHGTVNATSLVAGSVDIGGGTPITEYVSLTEGITLPVVDSQSCANFTTAAVTGFTPGVSDTIALGTPPSLLTGLGKEVFLVYQAWETTTTASPTITIQVCNPSGNRYAGGASGTLRVSIFKH